MIQFTTIRKNADGTWTFDWTSTGADEYRIIYQGVEIDVAITNSYSCDLHGFTNEPPAIEVVEDDELALSEENTPYIIFQWYPNRNAHHYEVQKYNGSS